MKKTPLSLDTQRRLDALFSEADREQAQRLLVDHCGNNLPFAEELDERDLERVRFAALKLSGGRLSGLREAIERAKIDSRDVLMEAGFGRDIHAHERWFPAKRPS